MLRRALALPLSVPPAWRSQVGAFVVLARSLPIKATRPVTHTQIQQQQQQQQRRGCHDRPGYSAYQKMAIKDEAAAAAAAGGSSSGGADDAVVVVDGTRYKTAREGLARIYVPLSGGDKKERQNGGGGPAVDDHPQQVFYNPIQQFNRDLSVLAIKAYGTSLVERRAAAHAQKREQQASKKRKRKQERSGQAGTDTGAGAAVPEEGAEAQAADKAGAEAGAEAKGEEAGEEHERSAKVEKRTEGQDAATAATELASRGAKEGNKTREVASEGGEAPKTAEGPPKPSAAAPPPPSSSAAPKIRILDALSATGLRALRYAHELPFDVAVTANDLLAAATESIRRNVALNGLQDKIEVAQSDALAHMYTVVAKDLTAVAEMAAAPEARHHHDKDKARAAAQLRRSEKYDVIDLDPYGTGANFFDAAVQAVRSDGGLLCVTCTDAGVWASQGYPEKCFALYGGVPMKGAHSHEAGLRVVLHALASSAARYGLAITPLLSLSIDFYCRVFVTVARSPASVKLLAGKTMVAYNCDQGCGAWTTQPLLRTHSHPNKKGSGTFNKYTFAAGPAAGPRCAHCDTKTHLAGPMYAGPLHQAAFVQRILDDLPQVSTDVYGTTGRIRGMLSTALEEIVEPAAAPTAVRGQSKDGEEAPAAAPASSPAEEDLAAVDPAAVDPAPFFFLPTNLAKAMHCNTPGEDAMRGALLRLGYRVTRSHCKAGSVKTDAPWAVLWDVMRAWVRQKAPVKRENIRPNTTAYRLLQIKEGEGGDSEGEVTTTNAAGAAQSIDFDERLGRLQGRYGDKLVRYQLNPRENWGPMNRAKGH